LLPFRLLFLLLLLLLLLMMMMMMMSTPLAHQCNNNSLCVASSTHQQCDAVRVSALGCEPQRSGATVDVEMGSIKKKL
jgi:hypothetical protein